MRVTVNGIAQAVPEGLSVASLLTSLKIASDRVAVEVNLSVVDKQAYHQVFLKEGDQVEVISFIGGGMSFEE